MLQQRQRLLDAGYVAGQQLGDRDEIAGQIAGLVDEIDQMAADQPVGGVEQLDAELLQQMLAQRRVARQRLVETGKIVAGLRRWSGAARHRAVRRIPGIGIAGVILLALAIGPGDVVPHLGLGGFALGAGGFRRLRRLARRLGLGRRFIALEQRILLDLGIDIEGKLDVRQLQQLDRLLQLRRHDQRLRLPKIETLG